MRYDTELIKVLLPAGHISDYVDFCHLLLVTICEIGAIIIISLLQMRVKSQKSLAQSHKASK